MMSLIAAIFITAMEFSVDGGASWSAVPPILEGDNAAFKLRVSWSGSDERPLMNGGFINESVVARGFKRDPARAVHGNVRAYVNSNPRPFVWNLDYTDLQPGSYKFSVLLFYVTQKGERVKAERDFWIWRKEADPFDPLPKEER